MEHWEWAEPNQEERSMLWGSGYPSDPKTVEWLKTNTDRVFGFPNIIRFSWAPVKNLQKDSPAVADVEWSDDEDEDDPNAAAAQGTAKLTSFFSAPAPAKKHASSSSSGGGGSAPAKKPRTAPYRERKLSLVDEGSRL